MNDKVGLRIISALILVAAIAGIAFFAFRVGIAQGSPVTIQAPSGQTAPVPGPYPYYGYGMPFHPWGFGWGFGCFAPLLVLFLFFIALRAFRFAFWGGRWGWGNHHYGPWGRHGENGVPPMFEEWHKRAHGEPTEEKKE